MRGYSLTQLVFVLLLVGLLLVYNRGVTNILGAAGPQLVGLLRAMLGQKVDGSGVIGYA